MSEYFRELTRAQDKINAAREAMIASAKDAITPALSAFIRDNPKINRVEWAQYTPYFNDGDTCSFSVYDPYFFASDDDEDGHDLYRSYAAAMESSYARPFAEAVGEETYNNCLAFARELSNLEEALQAVFGDHVKVIVTRDGVDVEGYDHD